MSLDPQNIGTTFLAEVACIRFSPLRLAPARDGIGAQTLRLGWPIAVTRENCDYWCVAFLAARCAAAPPLRVTPIPRDFPLQSSSMFPSVPMFQSSLLESKRGLSGRGWG